MLTWLGNALNSTGSFFGNLVSPITSWWGFVGEIPTLIIVGIVCGVCLVVIQFLKLFKRT